MPGYWSAEDICLQNEEEGQIRTNFELIQHKKKSSVKIQNFRRLDHKIQQHTGEQLKNIHK